MTHKHYILLDHKTGKLTKVSNTSIYGNNYLLSCSSRHRQRPFELLYRDRESKTKDIGIFSTAFPIILRISLSARVLSVRNSLLVLEVVDDEEGGSPSATMSGNVPLTSRHRASGTFLSAGVHRYIRPSTADKKVSQMQRDLSRCIAPNGDKNYKRRL